MSADKKSHYARFLILMPMGIGDAVAMGLSAIDQIVKNDPVAYGKIDVACNHLQATSIFPYAASPAETSPGYGEFATAIPVRASQTRFSSTLLSRVPGTLCL